MASKASRWAASDADAALDAQRRRQEREDKKRLKAARQRQRGERERCEADARDVADKPAATVATEVTETQTDASETITMPPAAMAAATTTTTTTTMDRSEPPPAKRRRLSNDRDNTLSPASPPSASAAASPVPAPTRTPAPAPAPALAPAPPAQPKKTTPAPSAKPPLRSAGAFGRCRSVDAYDKLNDIEEGTYGWVTRAREKATGRVVALKRLKMDPKDRGGLPVTGLREIQILRACDHRNVLRLREVVTGPGDRARSEDEARHGVGSVFLVLDFAEHDLRSVLEDMPEPFLASEVKTLLAQLAAGLGYLHDRWIVHRDLKTSNLLLTNRGQLKIADFGMARYAGDPGPEAGLTRLVVTLWYRPPELLLGCGGDYDARAVDMWGVGCVFGELLAGEPLLPGECEADELARIFGLCGLPTEDRWPGFRRLPNAKALRLPPTTTTTTTTSTTSSSTSPSSTSTSGGSNIRTKFPLLTTAGAHLLDGLLSLDPARRPSARAVLDHEYFRQDPRPKQEALFPTFPSRAGQERRRRRETPQAPARGQGPLAAPAPLDLGAVELGGIFAGRDGEVRGGGFKLRMA